MKIHKSVKTNPEMIQMIELVEKGIKSLWLYSMFQEGRTECVKENMEDVKKVQLKFLGMKSTISEMKYIMDGINRLGIIEERLM